jgi:hypothetical protein
MNELDERDPLAVGINLSVLLDQLKKYDEYIQNRSTLEVCEKVIKPFTLSKQCSLADLWSETHPFAIGKPQYFISHAWSYKFKDLLNGLRNYFRAKSETDHPIFVWVDFICINQHKSQSYDQTFWYGTFKNAITSIGKTLIHHGKILFHSLVLGVFGNSIVPSLKLEIINLILML